MPNGHRHPIHRLHKRATFANVIRARRREKHIRQRLENYELPQLPDVAASESPIVGEKRLDQRKHSVAEDLHDWILGGQDGLVNVLGSILGVAIVTSNKYIIIVAGLAALSAESISMAAVAYTSVKASHSYYHSQREITRKEIKENPILQREILIDIYERKGLPRGDAQRIVSELTRDEDIWLETLMEEHLRIYAPEETGALRSATIVGFAALAGSIIPLLPFFFVSGTTAIATSCVLSVTMLFVAGAASAKLTIGNWRARGLEMAAIGGTAAAVSFGIGFAAKLIVGI